MRAYLLGYNHGKDDGYFSTLIERGRCEAEYDESIDVEYVPVDKVLEIIDRHGVDLMGNIIDAKFSEIVIADVLASVRESVLALKGGDKE